MTINPFYFTFQKITSGGFRTSFLRDFRSAFIPQDHCLAFVILRRILEQVNSIFFIDPSCPSCASFLLHCYLRIGWG